MKLKKTKSEDRGFELDGKTVEKDAMERVVIAELESHPYRV